MWREVHGQTCSVTWAEFFAHWDAVDCIAAPYYNPEDTGIYIHIHIYKYILSEWWKCIPGCKISVHVYPLFNEERVSMLAFLFLFS